MIKLASLLREAMDLPPHVQFSKPQQAQVASTNAEKVPDSKLISGAAQIIKIFENNQNNRNGGYNKDKKMWFPHKSVEGGMPTLAYGHKITNQAELEKYKNGISENDAIQLLEKDIGDKLKAARRLIPNFNALPSTVKIAALNALYRGDMGPKTAELLNQGKYKEAAVEYLNHKEYKNTQNSGVKKRMDWNAEVFNRAAK